MAPSGWKVCRLMAGCHLCVRWIPTTGDAVAWSNMTPYVKHDAKKFGFDFSEMILIPYTDTGKLEIKKISYYLLPCWYLCHPKCYCVIYSDGSDSEICTPGSSHWKTVSILGFPEVCVFGHPQLNAHTNWKWRSWKKTGHFCPCKWIQKT